MEKYFRPRGILITQMSLLLSKNMTALKLRVWASRCGISGSESMKCEAEFSAPTRNTYGIFFPYS